MHRVARFFCRSPFTRRMEVDAKALTSVGTGPLLQIACEHGLSQLLYIVLRDAGLLSQLAAKEIACLAACYEEAAALAALRVEELRALDEALRAVGAVWVLLKAYAYDNTFPAPGCVRQGDLDVLVRHRDLTAATGAIERMGYARVRRPWQDEYRYKRPGKTPLDLHVAFGPHLGAWAAGAGDLEQTIACARRVPVGDWELPVLSPLDNVLFLLIHTALHHNFAPWSKVVTCWNSLVRWQDEVDPDTLQEALRRVGLGRLSGLAVDYLERLVGWPLPRIARSDCSPSWWERLGMAWGLPRPDAYLSAGTQASLVLGRRHGLHLCLYSDTWKDKARCIREVLRARRNGT